LYLAIAAICGLIFVPLHAVLVRARDGAKLIRTLATSIALSAVIGATAGWWLLNGSFSSAETRLLGSVAGGLTFAGAAGIYCHLLPISVDRSVSSHIVELIYLSAGHRLKEAELFRLYTHADVLGKRLRDCLETGIIERQGDELTTTPWGATIARVFLAVGKGLGMRLWYLDRFYGRGR
jgi:hypothetical protein